MVQAPHHHRAGDRYHVTIDVTLPGLSITRTHLSKHNPGHQDAYVAVREAFDTAQRRLRHQTQRRRELPLHRAGRRTDGLNLDGASALVNDVGGTADAIVNGDQ